jgi:hypothetical protein
MRYAVYQATIYRLTHTSTFVFDFNLQDQTNGNTGSKFTRHKH